MLQRQCSGELYEVLELDAQCTTAEVTQQYRRLALRYHPDRNAGTTVAHFQRIEEAHRVLTDPQQRQLYDAVGREGLKQLGDYGGGMVGSLLLAVGNIAAGCLLLGLMTTALFLSLLIGCYKLDAPREWPSWGVVLIPFWCLLPVVFLASVTVMAASVRRRTFILLLPSARLLLSCVAAAVTAAALDHRLRPVTAFIPWLVWYALGTVSDILLLVPTVYARTHSPLSDVGDDSGSGSGGGGGANSVDAAASHEHDGSHTRSTRPWMTWQYLRDVAEAAFEAVCVYTFIAFAFQRAAQQEARRRGRRASSSIAAVAGDALVSGLTPAAPPPPPVLSFWVVLAPLVVYFGAHVLLGALEAILVDSTTPTSPSSSPDEETPVNAATTAAGTAASSSSSPPPPPPRRRRRRASCGECLANVLLRTSSPVCGLYMVCMWAAKAEYEYNKRISGPDPSALLAFLPILILLGSLALLVCCGGCVVVCIGGALSAAEDRPATAAASSTPAPAPAAGAGAAAAPGAPPATSSPRSARRAVNGGGTTRSSAASNGRESRTPPSTSSSPRADRTHGLGTASLTASGGGGGGGTASSATSRGGTARDVAIEHID